MKDEEVSSGTMERVGDRSAAGGNAMKDRCRAFAWKSWMVLAVVLALVGMALRRGNARDGVRVVKSATRGACP